MQLNMSLSPLSLAVVALSTVLPLSTTLPTLAQTTAAETTLALCETPSHAIRIYRTDSETLMRAFNRQDGIVWMNHTPVSTETLSEGTRYINQLGEQTVTTLAKANGSDCTVQLGSNAPEAGTLLSNGPATADQILNQVRQIYPEPVAQLQAECPPTSTLDVKSFQNEGQPPRANFICWGAPNHEGERTGQWLGTLPLTEADPTFINPFTCAAGDPTCVARLGTLQTRHPEQLEAAELACSMKRGTLFFATTGDAPDLRCGFFATTLWDTNGDGTPNHEDAVGVDMSVGQVPQ